ncbi:hypothetical protein GCM10025783_21450 [Amnibacterium soli]|uniref:SGNH/GDSL hydrolase family protein n=1 Tax=Amnibacterium soli TaxID=1282736 RepID=A0ABP8Z7U8_9MICO
MNIRRAVAAGTGWFYRAARRAGVVTTASRQAALQASRTLPETLREVAAGSGAGAPLRIVLLGNGPAESPGAASGAAGFPMHLAQAVAARTRRRVEVKTLLGSAWDLPALEQQLKDEQLHRHDALVVTAAYRPQLAEIPLDHWAAYTAALRATLVRATGPEPVIRVLSLPWQDAARDAPLHWGGLFGNRVRAVAEIAESVLTPDQQALPLRLQGPVMHKEWVGPAFSGQTYLRWADQVAGELCAAWRL